MRKAQERDKVGEAAGEGRSENMTRRGGAFKSPQPRDVVPEVLWDLVAIAEEALPPGPDVKRVRLRTLRGKLLAAFPQRFEVSASELAQQIADEEGDPIDGY